VTLLELVVVLIITSILASAAAVWVTRPIEGYRDLTRRARLVDAAEGALRRLARDVRRAVPNSIRVGAGGLALEMLHAADGAEYRRQPGTNPGPVPHGAPSDWLSFAAAGDAQWNALGRFRSLAFGYGVPLPAGTRIAVYPTDAASLFADAASGANPGIITPAPTGITLLDDVDEDQVQLSASHRFRFASPARRFYLVDSPVTHLCDPVSGTLTRYSAYAIAQAQPVDPAVAPLATASRALATRRVAACNFQYQPGTSQRAGLVTLQLSLSEAGEQIRLLHQIHVENAP
jgi:MSHA biogenesis protein MshO